MVGEKRDGQERCAGATPKGCGVWRGRMGQLARDLEPCVLGPNFSHHKVALVLSALRSLIVREGWWESCCHRPSPQAKGFGCYEASRIVPGTRWTPNKHWLALFQPAELFIMKGHGQRACHERPKHRKLSLPSQVEQTLEIQNAPKNLCAHWHGVLSGKFHSKELWFMHKIVFKFCRVTSDQHVEVYDTYMYFTFGLVPFLKCFIMDMQICQNPNYANSETF